MTSWSWSKICPIGIRKKKKTLLFGRTCRRTYEISCEDSLWKNLCDQYWHNIGKCGEETWKSHFGHLYLEYGRYLHIYPKLKSLWDRLEIYLQEHCPLMAPSLQGGASEELLNEVEQNLGVKLPLELRCFYRIHNGQMPGSLFGLFGNIPLQNFTHSEVFLKASAIFQPLSDTLRPHCLAFAICHLTQLKICIALQDYPGLKAGSIFHLANHTTEAFCLDSSLVSWFSLYVERLTAGEYIIADSLIYRMIGARHCQATTAHITVRVSTVFLPELSTAKSSYFCFAYHIIMEMDQNAPSMASCHLQSRHWIICNDRGEEQHVQGPGVVGEFPIMLPGSLYSWDSYTNLNTPSGYMQGYFTMVNLITQLPVEVECPRFYLQAPLTVDLKETSVQPNNS